MKEENVILKNTVAIECDNGIKLIYNFSFLNIWQCEMGESIGRFILDQSENPPDSFETRLKSGGALWLSWLASYLFCREGDEAKSKDELYAHAILDILRNLNGQSEYATLKQVTNDFFTGIGQSWMSSMLWPNKSNEKGKQQLLTSVLSAAIMNAGRMNSLLGDSDSKPSIPKAKPGKGR